MPITVFYRGMFSGAPITAGAVGGYSNTVNDAASVGPSGDWLQAAGQDFNTDGTGHLVVNPGVPYYYSARLLETGIAAMADGAITAFFDSFDSAVCVVNGPNNQNFQTCFSVRDQGDTPGYCGVCLSFTVNLYRDNGGAIFLAVSVDSADGGAVSPGYHNAISTYSVNSYAFPGGSNFIQSHQPAVQIAVTGANYTVSFLDHTAADAILFTSPPIALNSANTAINPTTAAGFWGFAGANFGPNLNNGVLGCQIDNNGASAPATGLTVTGSTVATVGSPSATQTVGANGTLSGATSFTMSDGGHGGTFSPASPLSISPGSPTTNFTYDPAQSGSIPITLTASSLSGSPTLYYIVCTAPAATHVTLTGPSTGNVGVASVAFTAGVDGSLSGPVVVTPSDGSSGGTFSPTSVTLTSGAPSATFTYTAISAGAKSIAVANNGSLTNPSAVPYTASAVAATALTLNGPSTGIENTASAPFTVAANGSLSGPVVVTVSVGTGATATPSTLTLNGSTLSGTFTVNSAVTTAVSVSITNNGGLAVPATPLSYTASATTAKPPNPTLATGISYGANAVSYFPICETVAGGGLADLVTAKITRPNPTIDIQTGLPPSIISNGFAAEGLTGNSAKFNKCGMGLTGSSGTAGGTAYPFSYAAVMKPHIGDGDQSFAGSIFMQSDMGVYSYGIGMLPTGANTLSLVAETFTQQEPLGITLPSASHWYAIAVDFLSATTAKIRVYDLTSGTYLTTQSGGNAVAFSNAIRIDTSGTAAIYLGCGCSQTNTGSNFYGAFPGELAAALVRNTAAWTDAQFAAFAADPFALARGPSPVGNGSTLAAGDASAYSRHDGIVVSCAPPIGGATNGVYGYQWEYSPAPTWAPGTGTALSGATTREFLDATAIVNVPRYYVCRQTCTVGGSTSTVYTAPCFGARLRGNFGAVCVGTSLVQEGSSHNIGLTLSAYGIAATVIDRARGGTDAGQWYPGGGQTWLADAIADAQANGCQYLMVDFGTNATTISPSTWYGYMSMICQAAVAGGLKVLIGNPIFRFDSLATESLLLGFNASIAMLGNDSAYPTLIQGTNVILVDTDVSPYLPVGQPWLLEIGGLHWDNAAYGTRPGSGILIAGMARALAVLRSLYGLGGSVDPGNINVRSGTSYTINGVAETGSLSVGGGSSADPGTANVRKDVPYEINGTNLTGTYDPETGRYTDPGTAFVASGHTYVFAGATETGAFAGSGGGPNALSSGDLANIGTVVNTALATATWKTTIDPS